MFRRIRNYISNKGLCYSVASKSKKVQLSVCGDLDAARINTPYSNILVNIEDIPSSLTEAYKVALDKSDETVAEEVHSIRQAIQGAYA